MTITCKVEQAIYCGRECKCDLRKVPVTLQLAVIVGSDAVQEDYNKDYAKAVLLYEQSEEYFLQTINAEKKNENKDLYRMYCKKYTDRIKILKAHLDKKKKNY